MATLKQRILGAVIGASVLGVPLFALEEVEHQRRNNKIIGAKEFYENGVRYFMVEKKDGSYVRLRERSDDYFVGGD